MPAFQRDSSITRNRIALRVKYGLVSGWVNLIVRGERGPSSQIVIIVNIRIGISAQKLPKGSAQTWNLSAEIRLKLRNAGFSP